MYKANCFGENGFDFILPFECEIHHCFPRSIPSQHNFRVLCHTCEPSPLKWPSEEVRKFSSNFDLILTSDKKLIDLPNVRFLIFGDCWIRDLPINLNKELNVSYLHSVGIKADWDGYNLRNIIWKNRFNLKSSLPINIWASSRRPPEDIDVENGDKLFDKQNKSILFDSMFSICIENIPEDDYFTEKLIDALISETIPIYFGCPNIGDYFNLNGIIIINNIDELNAVLSSLSINDYYQRKSIIQENKLLAFEYIDGFERIQKSIMSAYNEINKTNYKNIFNVILNNAKKPTERYLVVRLKGGIGNQLFQLSYSLNLAHNSDANLLFDVSSYSSDTYGNTSILNRIFSDYNTVKLDDLDSSTTFLLNEQDFLSKNMFIPSFVSWPKDCSYLVLDGYWQDSRYVLNEEIVDSLREGILKSLNTNFSYLSDLISSNLNPVSMHVRRRDYKHHGVCSEKYYIDSIRWFINKKGLINLFVFSDEPNYTHHFLNEAGIAHTIVNSGDDLTDLYLMSLCKSHIISNSTFSWWGARLSRYQDVISPLPWSYIHNPSAQLCPQGWRKINNAVEKIVNNYCYINEIDSEEVRLNLNKQ
jgi:hypothetical protein